MQQFSSFLCEMKPIFLVGFMGSGKSKLGKALAKKLKLDFLDTDKMISDQQGLSVSALFEKFGEEHFRTLEKTLVESIKDTANCVVATGGGLPCSHQLMDKLNEKGITIYLELNPKELFSRLHSDENRSKRPLLQGKDDDALLQYIENKLSEREIIYRQAQIIFHPTKDKLADLSQSILRREKNS